jgi:glycosyltransferase 2 family protein
VKRALRIVAGVALLALAIWYADPRALAASLGGVDPWLFAAAVGVATVANVFSALRWSAIARRLGLVSPVPQSLLMYARAITANMMLPGSLVSGDVLRSFQLSRLGNPLVASAWSVFLDRFSGLWILCGMSALAALGVALWRPEMRVPLQYAAVLAALAAAPLLPFPLPKSGRLGAMAQGLQRSRPALLGSAGYSFVVQCLAAGTLWICSLAVGLSLSYPVMLAAAAPIFIMAALPIGVAGFGAREVAAVAVLGFLGVSNDQAFATGLLYGLAAVVQGILAAPLFFAKAQAL